MVSLANRVRPLGGTHGALGATNSLGVLMTNFQDTHDDLTKSVRAQFDGFQDFGDVKVKVAGARLSSAWLLQRDERSAFPVSASAPIQPTHAYLLEVWLAQKEAGMMAAGNTLRIETRRRHEKAPGDSLLSVTDLIVPAVSDDVMGFPGVTWRLSDNRRHVLVDLPGLFGAPPAPNATYQLRVSLRRPPSGQDTRTESTHLVTLVVRANDLGEIWPY